MRSRGRAEPKPIATDAATRLSNDTDQAAAAMKFRGDVVDGFLVVRVVDGQGQNGVVVRRTRFDGVAPPDAAVITASERTAARRWLAAERRRGGTLDSRRTAGARRLDRNGRTLAGRICADNPTHLGMMRDLLAAEVQLLSFEAGSPFGPRVV